jgi:hypothetical protein
MWRLWLAAFYPVEEFFASRLAGAIEKKMAGATGFESDSFRW